MAETHHKKQQITAALTEVRIQVQNEVAHLKRTLEETHPGIDQKSSVGMGRLRWASFSRTRTEKENLYS